MSDMPDIDFALDYMLDDRARELYHRAVWAAASYIDPDADIPWLEFVELRPEPFPFLHSALIVISETFDIPWGNVRYDISRMRVAIQDQERAAQQAQVEYDTPETAGAKASQARRVADMFQHVFGRGEG